MEKNIKKLPPLSTRTKMGKPPALDLKERSKSEKLLHPLWFDLGYITAPTIVPPYWGTPKFPIAHSYIPFIDSGDVTFKLFFSTTNLPIQLPIRRINQTHTKNPNFSVIFPSLTFLQSNRSNENDLDQKNELQCLIIGQNNNSKLGFIQIQSKSWETINDQTWRSNFLL